MKKMIMFFILFFSISLYATLPFGLYIYTEKIAGKIIKRNSQFLHLRPDNYYIFTTLKGDFSAGIYHISKNFIVFEDGDDTRKFRFFLKGQYLTFIATKGGDLKGHGHLGRMFPTKIGKASTYHINNPSFNRIVKYGRPKIGTYEYWDSYKKQVHTLILKDNNHFTYINPKKKQIQGSYKYSGKQLVLKTHNNYKRKFLIIRIGSNLILLRIGNNKPKGKSLLATMKPYELRGAFYEVE